MKTLILTAAIVLLANAGAYAASPTCNAQAAEKKLAGAAKTNFTKKCERMPPPRPRL